MEIIIFSLVLVLFAGVINGSFATPMKYMTKWDEENIWFIFSFSGFLILPWLSIYFMSPNVGQVLNAIPSKLLWTMIFGGLAFGIGQIAFATSFRGSITGLLMIWGAVAEKNECMIKKGWTFDLITYPQFPI